MQQQAVHAAGDGVELEYIAEDAMLYFTVRYRKYLVRRNRDGSLDDCPSVYLTRLINRERVYREVEKRGDGDGSGDGDNDDGNSDQVAATADLDCILAGAEFFVEDSLYRVTEHRVNGLSMPSVCTVSEARQS